MPRQSRLEYDRRGHYWVSPVKNVLLSYSQHDYAS